MGTGYLKVQTTVGDSALAVANAHVMLMDEDASPLYETYTDANGNTQELALPTPDALMLGSNCNRPAYSTWIVAAQKEGFAAAGNHRVEIADGQVLILPVQMSPLPEGINARAEADICTPSIGQTPGTQGDAVRLMQSYINTISGAYPNIPKLDVDGVFGPKTVGAVIAFQIQFSLNPDGVIGPTTWDYIVKQYLSLTGGDVNSSLWYPGVPLQAERDEVRYLTQNRKG